MAARKKDTINLLPERGFASTTTGRILAWVLSTFRIIVIVTEILVMIAFLSRFWLDAQNTDLSEEIEQKKAVLVAASDFETDFKLTQKRLAVYSKIEGDQKKATSVIQKITNLIPLDISLTSVDISKRGWSISGKSSSEKSVQQFIVSLQSEPEIETVDIAKVSSPEEDPSALNFELNLTLAGSAATKKDE